MNAATILAGLPIWQSAPEVTPIAAGRTNQNYLIAHGRDRFFARIGSDRRDLGINRATEAACCWLASEHGIGPAVHYAGDGILVQTYLPGETLRPQKAPDNALLHGIAILLRRLHAIPLPRHLPAFDPVATSRRYLADLSDAELPLPRRSIAARLATLRSGIANVVVHGDLIPENILRHDNRLYLIDWEYAGAGAPEVDLALVLANFGLSGATAAQFLTAYGDHDSGLLVDMTIACIVREALWCLVQGRHARSLGEDAGDLPAYTALCFERLQEILA